MKYVKTLVIIILLIATVSGTLYMVKVIPAWFTWLTPEPITKTVTITEPAKVIFLPGPSPKPIIIEKVVIKDGQVTFKQDIPFQGKTIQGDSFKVTYAGIYHTEMTNGNTVQVKEEITGDVALTVEYKTKPPALTEAGVMYDSTGVLSGYYRRYLTPIVIFHPWVEIQIPFTGSQQTKIVAGIPIKF